MLSNPKWANNRITSNYRQLLLVSWLQALICLTLGLVPIIAVALEDEFDPSVFLLLVICLILTMVGLGILSGAVKRTRTWLSVGTMELRLDPFPGSVGGDVGGRIYTHLSLHKLNQAPIRVTLQCTEYYLSPKSRERHSRSLWQREGLAQAYENMPGSELRFRFELPQDLPHSSPKADKYHRWFLTLHADLPAATINRRYEIPVLATGECSSESLWNVDWREHPGAEQLHLASVESLLNIEQRADGIRLNISAGKAAISKLCFMVIGAMVAGGCGYAAIFTPVGWIIGGPLLMGAFFATVIALACLFQVFRSLKVDINRDRICCNTYLLGLKVWRQAALRKDINSLYLHCTSSDNFSGRTTEFFELRAELNEPTRNDILLAVELKNKDTALAALEAIAMLGGYSFQKEPQKLSAMKKNKAKNKQTERNQKI